MEEEYEAAGGEVLVDNDENDGWLATHGKPKGIAILDERFFFVQIQTPQIEMKIYFSLVAKHYPFVWIRFFLLLISFYCVETVHNDDDEEKIPSIESLTINSEGPIRSISTYFGGAEEDDIPDMADFGDPDNLLDADPVS